MGSTLETSLVISAVLLLLTFLILAPLEICGECLDLGRDGKTELDYQLENSEIITSRRVGGRDAWLTSPEMLCTFLTGLSENYRIIYGSLTEVVND